MTPRQIIHELPRKEGNQYLAYWWSECADTTGSRGVKLRERAKPLRKEL